MTVTLAGEAFSLDQFTADGGRGHRQIMPASGTRPAEPLFPDRIFGRLLEELDALRAPGALSTSTLTPATGAVEFALLAPATLRAGVYQAISLGDPAALMVGSLAADVSATSSLTLAVAFATGGERADWIITPVAGGRGRTVVTTATALALTAAHADFLIRCTVGGITITLPAAAAVGAGWAVSIASDPAGGVVTVDADGGDLIAGRASILLPAGHSVDLVCAGDGTWVVAGGAYRITQTVVFPAAALLPDPSAAPELTATAPGGRALRLLAFDAAAAETAWAQLTLPASWDPASAIRARLHALRTQTAASHGVVWMIAGAASGPGESAAVPPATSAADCICALSSLDWIFGGEADDTVAVPVAGAPQPGDVLSVAVTRDVAHTADDCAVDAGLIDLVLELDCIRFGSDA
ncbi:MAG: hypothetical protein OHK0024_21300 [Thalassobaculales bacterium]